MRKDLVLPRWAGYAAGGVLMAVALTAGALSLTLNVMHGLEAGFAAGIAFGLADIGKILLPVVAGMIGWSRQMRATAAICVAVSLWSAVNVYLDGAGRDLLVKQHGAMIYAEAEKQIAELEREAASLRSLAAAEAGKGGCRQNCRALTEQALCEQVVGRGLRRVSYDTDENGLFRPEYVNVFGVPLSISETGEGGDPPPPPRPATQIEVIPDRAHLEIKWPNVLRVETVVKPQLTMAWDKVPTLALDPASTPISAELAPALGGATDMGQVTAIDLERLPDGFRLQRLVFQAARKGFAELQHSFSGTEEYLAAQLVRIVESFLNSKLLDIPSLFHSDPLRRRILIALNIDLVVQHVMRHVSEQNTERLTPVFDEENPIGATGQMRTWYTTKPCFPAIKSHISHLVGDSSWEGHAANICEGRDDVVAYAKNDHLGFQIQYMWAGSRRRYVPDFVVRLSSGKMLALEIKGTDSPQNKAKRDALDEWVKAVNGIGGFGQWTWDVAFKPIDVQDIVSRHAKAAVAEPMAQ